MDYKSLWEKILTRLAPTIGKTSILSFFKDSIISEIDNGVMKVSAPTSFAFTHMRERHQSSILQAAKEETTDVKEVAFSIDGRLADGDHPHKINIQIFQTIEAKNIGQRKVPKKQEVFVVDGLKSKMFNDSYTLDNFIPGQDNKLAHAACQAVSVKPGNIYNPLFLYGGVGMGKTHLLQGIGIEIARQHPNKKVVYMTSEKFIQEIVAAIGRKNTKSFKDRYRNVDCLIVDDIQFFGNKASSQQEFFHTFNELYDAKKQIVLSSDRPPKELDGLEDRLKSRFSMGMVVEVLLPDFETRLAILREKCKEYEVLVDPEVLEFIAYNVSHSVRELVGILVNAIADSHLTQTTPTISSVAKTIRSLYKDHEFTGMEVQSEKRLVVKSSEDLIDVVAKYYSLTKSDLVGGGRRKEVMIPRQVCMYLIREMLDESYEAIGESFGGRNHTTVLHACNKILGALEENSRVKRDINALKREIGLM